MNLRSSSLYRDDSYPFTLSKVGVPTLVELRAKTVEKCKKKCEARAELLCCLLNPTRFRRQRNNLVFSGGKVFVDFEVHTVVVLMCLFFSTTHFRRKRF